MVSQRQFDGLVIVVTTETNNISADSLAKGILSRKLAACVSLRPVKSYFWWEGELEENNEVQLLIKTTTYKLQNLIDTINQLHSYTTPELLYWNISASEPYKEWIVDIVSSSSNF